MSQFLPNTDMISLLERAENFQRNPHAVSTLQQEDIPGATAGWSEFPSLHEDRGHVCVIAIILQYGNWRDTALCVESVLGGDFVPDWIVIVDNASPDDSAESFLTWARGEVKLAPPDFLPLRSSPKPLPLTALSEQALNDAGMPETRCVFVRMAHNGGYAAGNNVGISLGLRWGADAFLLLNNDTMVTASAIRALRDRLFACTRPGLCGGLLRYCHGEKLVQCLAGGHTNPRTALSRITGQGLTLKEALRVPRDEVEAHINYVCGACVMASRQFVEKVGLLDEGYFLYCEEQDWAYRAAGEFDVSYAPDALVWHREGATTGWNGRGAMPLRPLLRLTVSRLRCTWLHHPRYLPIVLLGVIYAALNLFGKKTVEQVAAWKQGILASFAPLVQSKRIKRYKRKCGIRDIGEVVAWGKDYIIHHLRVRFLYKAVVPATIHFRETGSLMGARICLFAHYTPDGMVSENTCSYMRQLAECGFCVIFIHAGKLHPHAMARLKGLCHAVASVSNGGYDFAMWKAAMLALPEIWLGSELLLANSSVWLVGELGAFFSRMDTQACDFWGCTSSMEGGAHLQSYLLCFHQVCFSHRAFIEFWDQVAILLEKEDVIRRYELKLTRCLTRGGLRSASFVPATACMGRDNPTLHHPQSLLAVHGTPFLKKQLVRENPCAASLLAVRDILANRNLAPALMEAIFPSAAHREGIVCQIVLAVHNGAPHLQELLDSLPSSPEVCVLARDDGSSDTSPAILARQAADRGKRMQVHRGERLGCTGNFSWLLEHVDAPYFMLADQDDVWDAEKYAVLLDAMRALETRYGAEAPLLVYADTRLIDENGHVLHPSGFMAQACPPSWSEDFRRALVMSNASGCTMLGNRTLARMATPIPAAAYMHDWWLLLVATGLGAAQVVNRPLVSYRQHGGNTLGANRYAVAHALRIPWSERHHRIVRTQEQAAAFLERFGPSLSPFKRKVCESWAAMPQRKWWSRISHCIWRGYTKPGFLRQLGLWLCN